MRAILLAAGVGRRMGPDAGPKCLIDIGGRSLLQRSFDALQSVGVRDLVLVVGFQKEAVEAHARKHAGTLHLTVLENLRYREGAILSLWTARSHLDDDLLIMDADVLCPPLFYERLVHSRHKNCLLVDPAAVNTGEEQIVLGQGSRVLFITKEPSQELLSRMTCFGESIGFLKLERTAAGLLRKILEAKVSAGVVQIEHEQAYPDLFRELQTGFETSAGPPWIEIDTPEDLRRAREEILPQWSVPPCWNRQISRWFLPWILRLPVAPNQWTGFGFLLGLGSVVLIASGDYRDGLLAAALFELFYLVDNWDGEVARARGLSSYWGGWFDVGVDLVVQVGLSLGLAVGLLKGGAPSWVMAVGWLAAAGLAFDFIVTLWGKVRGFGPAVYGDPARGTSVSSDSRFKRWIRANWTNENFSLLVAAVLLLDRRLPFLLLLALGSQFYWIRFLWRERARLF